MRKTVGGKECRNSILMCMFGIRQVLKWGTKYDKNVII